ncbi:g9784 [Coccomyxa viridis]|uniref:G9784 protein n=1 Tax=Coccomyxa viridis TaxID=1274662 RepID=A0ABP1G461_9CHLO
MLASGPIVDGVATTSRVSDRSVEAPSLAAAMKRQLRRLRHACPLPHQVVVVSKGPFEHPSGLLQGNFL